MNNFFYVYYPHIFEYGGIERNIIGLAESATRYKRKIVVVCHFDKINFSHFHPNIELVSLGDDINPLKKAGLLFRFLSNSNIRTRVLAFGTKAGFYMVLSGYKSYVLHYTDPPSLLPGKPAITWPFSILRKVRESLAHFIMKLSVKRAAERLTMTNWNALELERLYGYKFDVVYQGGTAPKTGMQRQINNMTDIKWFSICRHAGSKNLDWILYATQKLRSALENQGFRLSVVIAGDGPDRLQLEKLSEALLLNDIVRFPGFLEQDEVEYHYNTSMLFLVPGRQGYGLPVLEALYRRVPVVMNRESRVSEILEENPWVSVSEDSLDSFTASISNHMRRIKSGPSNPSYLTYLPTEASWAEALGDKMGWWKVAPVSL